MSAPAADPFFGPWNAPFQAIPFGDFGVEAFADAFERALAAHSEELDACANNPAPASFENTMLALERAGGPLSRVTTLFSHLCATEATPALNALELTLAPRLARHRIEYRSNAALFARVDVLHARRTELGLDPESQRLIERHHIEFVRNGARLGAAEKLRLQAVMERLADLFARFRQNVMADERKAALVLESPADLAGLPEDLRAAAAAEAESRGLPGRWVISPSRSSVEPFLQASERRDLRRIAFEAWTQRGDHGETDNKPVIAEIVALRTERAHLLGFASFADYTLADSMAATADAAEDLLRRVWGPARVRALEERDALQAVIEAEGGGFALAAWDWRHYTEKIRRERFALDENELKPYFELGRMIEAVQEVARRLFGVTFHPRDDLPRQNAEVHVWEVRRADGTHLGLFYGDYFARAGKRSGAWMECLRLPHALDGGAHSIVCNVCNFVKPAPGRPALLSLGDARTLFHEFGHGLHGLLSQARYPSLAATAVALDFVELPSQLYEHWLLRPEVLRGFALHCETGEPLPEAVIERIEAARHFNAGFASIEMISSALVDLAYHRLTTHSPEAPLDPADFEARTLAGLGMPDEIVMRHRSPHFAHIFDGDFYAAGYYAYLWAEVLDADGFEAFVEAGDVFDRDTADRLQRFIYGAGNTADPAALYRAFRGRDPGVEPMLAGRGLSTT